MTDGDFDAEQYQQARRRKGCLPWSTVLISALLLLPRLATRGRR